MLLSVFPLHTWPRSTGTSLKPTWFHYNIWPRKNQHATETNNIPLSHLSKEVLHATETIRMLLLMSVTEAKFSPVVTSVLCWITTWFCDVITTSKLECNWGGFLYVIIIIIHHLASVFVWRYFYYRHFECSLQDSQKLARSQHSNSIHCSGKTALEFYVSHSVAYGPCTKIQCTY